MIQQSDMLDEQLPPPACIAYLGVQVAAASPVTQSQNRGGFATQTTVS